MAGDWIKMRTGLDASPKTWRVANRLGMEPEGVVALLYLTASWFAKSGKYGKIDITPAVLDLHFRTPGLAAALVEVGWLRFNEGGSATIHWFSAASVERKSFGASVRQRILSGAVCAACGSTGKLEIDHKVPISRGGSCEEHNLQALCVPCNRAKGKKTMEEFLRDR